jgi:hypothetical protein
MSKPSVPPFDINDLDRTVSDADRLIMIETILAWADLDTGISRLILLVFGVEDDAGSILIGNMDLKTKVERIKMLYDHRGESADAASLAKLITTMKHFSVCRNSVAHRKLIGRLFSDPTRMVFLSARHIKHSTNQFEMVSIHHSELIESGKFARKASEKIHDLIATLEDR